MLDGNMKNRRDVCMAKDAGSIEYPGLPGHIKSGCTASPKFNSLHAKCTFRCIRDLFSLREVHIYMHGGHSSKA